MKAFPVPDLKKVLTGRPQAGDIIWGYFYGGSTPFTNFEELLKTAVAEQAFSGGDGIIK